MEPIEELEAEHRTIERVIAALESYARALHAGDRPPPADLDRLAGWFADYADAEHHGKEEDILFAEVDRHGLAVDDGPLDAMFEQHREARRLVAALRDAAAAGAWDDARAERAARIALDYAGLLRGHIHTEDHAVYPLCRRHLPPAAWDAIVAAFAAHAATHASARARLIALADELAAAYPG